MDKDYLGTLEQTVMWAVLRLGENAYGMTIRREIADRTERDISIGAVYATLDRLEEKGYLSTSIGEATAERGGRAKKYFRLSAAGRRVLSDSQKALMNMASGFEPILGV